MISLPILLILQVAVAAGTPPSHDRCLQPPFVGITETSVTADLVGHVDHRDWGCADPATGQTVAGAAEAAPPPGQPALCFRNAYPNPAQGNVSLEFSLAASGEVSVTIYSQTRGHGRPEAVPVRTLVHGVLVPGAHRVIWDLADDHGTPVPSGIYRAVLDASGAVLCGDIEVP